MSQIVSVLSTLLTQTPGCLIPQHQAWFVVCYCHFRITLSVVNDKRNFLAHGNIPAEVSSAVSRLNFLAHGNIPAESSSAVSRQNF